jgi:hypothetical protein
VDAKGAGSSWTDIVAATSTALLALTALVAGFVAIRQFKFLDAAERRKVTFALIREYTIATQLKDYSSSTDVVRSPLQAHQKLAEIGKSELSAQSTGKTSTPATSVGEVMTNYYLLRNYLDEVDDLYSRQLIDRDFYLSRHVRIISTSVALLGKFTNIVAGVSDDTHLLGRLDKIARDFKARRRLPSNTSP